MAFQDHSFRCKSRGIIFLCFLIFNHGLSRNERSLGVPEAPVRTEIGAMKQELRAPHIMIGSRETWTWEGLRREEDFHFFFLPSLFTSLGSLALSGCQPNKERSALAIVHQPRGGAGSRKGGLRLALQQVRKL